jgi:hypothetical protein
VQTWQSIATGTLSAPDHAYPSYLELQLTATDSAGATSTSSVQLNPKTVNLTFASAPSGLSLTVNAATAVTPFVRTVVVKSSNSVSAPTPQTLGGSKYAFSSWSDNGATTHNIVAPATPTTYTAGYTAQVAPTNTGLPAISGAARVGSSLSTSKGAWSGTQPMTYTYQWLQCDSAGNNCSAIAGATSGSYVVRSADRSHRLRARVTAANAVGSTPATSAATATVGLR